MSWALRKTLSFTKSQITRPFDNSHGVSSGTAWIPQRHTIWLRQRPYPMTSHGMRHTWRRQLRSIRMTSGWRWDRRETPVLHSSLFSLVTFRPVESRVLAMNARTSDATPSAIRRQRRQRVELLANQQDGVVSLLQVYSLGITRAEVRANVQARRWNRVGRQSLIVHTGPVDEAARWWTAVFEAGPRAFLDGESALLAAGLKHYTSERIRVSLPRGARVRRVSGVDVRQTRRWAPTDVAVGGIPRARPEVAAVRAALWATSDKQAALLLTMSVQQGLATAEGLGREMLRIKRDRRREFIHSVLLDLLGGVRSVGELEFARECRQRGLPVPTRQVVRRGTHGRYYLDVLWEDWNVCVEIDGIHHSWATNVVADALRHNDLTLQRTTVLRLPLLGFRVAPDEFFGQIESALINAGCPINSWRAG